MITFFVSFFLLAIFLFSPKAVLAQVVINEFSSDTAGTTADPDWVEFYNTSDSVVNLSQFRIEDYGATNTKTLSGEIGVKGLAVVDWSNKLNKTGDEINLIKVSDGSFIDKVGYGDRGADISAPGSGQSAGRETNGSPKWSIFSQPTKGANNGGESPAPTPTSQPTSTPTPNSQPPTPTSSSKATYKINEVKNEDEEVLSSVKIYVDGNYVHHYAPEILTFCDGCKCDTDVGCGFGSHTISLEKSGYQNWRETKTINSGDSYEVNPVMNFASSTSSSAPTLSPTTPAKSSLVSAGESATPKETDRQDGSSQNLPGEILGEEATLSGEATESAAFFTTPSASPTPALESKSGWQKNLPKIFLILGGGSFLIGGLLLAKQKLKEKFSQSDVII